MSTRIALIGCSRAKRGSAQPVEHLYLSHRFRLCLEWARAHSDSWGVLSAKHHLVLPGTVIEPYDEVLTRFDQDDLRHWAWHTGFKVYRAWGNAPTFLLLCGERYRTPFERWNTRGFRFEVPMQGLGIGQQLKWLKDELQAPQREQLGLFSPDK